MSEVADAPKKSVSVADLVEKYIKLRDRRDERKRAFTEADKADEAIQETIEGLLLKFMQTTGQDSAKTPAGTAYTSTQVSATIADKLLFREFVQNNDAWELADVRASKKAIEQYQADHGGQLPPGVNYTSRIVVNVRRSA